jgi:DNA-binding protein YbaB
MFAPLHNEMTSALSELRAQQEKIADAVGRLQEVTTTSSTKDNMVSATVDGQGKLVELSFRGRRWRDLAPKELAAKIVEVVTDAQGKAFAATAGVMSDLVPAGLDIERLREVGPDLESMFDDAMKEARRWQK